jgi:hypothetical protein
MVIYKAMVYLDWFFELLSETKTTPVFCMPARKKRWLGKHSIWWSTEPIWSNYLRFGSNRYIYTEKNWKTFGKPNSGGQKRDMFLEFAQQKFYPDCRFPWHAKSKSFSKIFPQPFSPARFKIDPYRYSWRMINTESCYG